MDKMKPCPFCVGEAIAPHFEADSYSPPCYRPLCTKCGCRLRGAETEADAVRRWNTRTPSEAVLVEAVQNYVNARDDFRLFERTYPNDCTNRWDRVFEAVNTAEGELRAALAAAKGERV